MSGEMKASIDACRVEIYALPSVISCFPKSTGMRSKLFKGVGFRGVHPSRSPSATPRK